MILCLLLLAHLQSLYPQLRESLTKMGNLFFASLNLHVPLFNLLLQRGDHGQVVEGDVVVVVLDLVERLLVALLDVLDLVVLPLLHMAHLNKI